jgi:DNA-directed RNA polymerase subunit RPC12/RpoP
LPPWFFHRAAGFELTRALPHVILPSRFRQGGTVIKFFCLNCGQKLAADDEGVGAVVACTNCDEQIVVPPHSVTESSYAESAARYRRASFDAVELMPPSPVPVGSVPSPVRMALIPQLARMMMSRLVQALFAQRMSLLDTQAEATQRMAELEERVAQVQASVQKKIAAYEARIAELEEQLAGKEEENNDLRRANFQLANKVLEAETAARSSRVDLRDAGFLLRA